MPKARTIPATVPGAPLHVNASLPLMIRLEELVRYDRYVRDVGRVEELHDLRIAAKRMRYTLEVFAPVVEDSAAFLKTLKSLQERLGAIHDVDVLAPFLAESVEDPAAVPGVQALADGIPEERERLYREFLEQWEGFLADGIPMRLWNAAFAASGPDSGETEFVVPALEAGDDGAKPRLLPRKRIRRLQKAVVLLRLAKWAEAAAPPAQLHRLNGAVLELETLIAEPRPKSKVLKSAMKLLCRTIAHPVPAEDLPEDDLSEGETDLLPEDFDEEGDADED
jgi:hypothetical protein